MDTMLKYKPKNINEFVFADEESKKQIMRYIDRKTMLPLILYGPCGSGKSTLADLIPKEREGRLNVEITKVNADDLNSSKEVRDKFLRDEIFDSLFSVNGQEGNYTIVEEVNIDPKSKGALRVCLDKMLGRSLTIFTTNELDKLDSGTFSRATKIRIDSAKPETFLSRAKEILNAESIHLEDIDLLEILESAYDLSRDNREYFRQLDLIIEAAQDKAKKGG